VHLRPWLVPLQVLLVSLLAASQAGATGRESRQGTVLVAGRPGETPPVLYVAARFSTLVDFEGLLEPRAPLTPELEARVRVAPMGPRSLVVVLVHDLAEGERLLLPVTGRTEAGESRSLTLALVTRRDEVDAQVSVSLAMEEAGEDTMLLASPEPGTRPRMALVTPGEGWALERSGDIQARVDSVLRVERRLFVTVTLENTQRTARPWRLSRVRLETRCGGARAGAEFHTPVLITTAALGPRWQRLTFSTRMPEGAGCLALTLEEDGPRTFHFEDSRLPP
jgi:hypothetical protein